MSPALALAWLAAASNPTDLNQPRRYAYDAFKKSYKEVATIRAGAA
jgi:hypothetical protein